PGAKPGRRAGRGRARARRPSSQHERAPGTATSTCSRVDPYSESEGQVGHRAMWVSVGVVGGETPEALELLARELSARAQPTAFGECCPRPVGEIRPDGP